LRLKYDELLSNIAFNCSLRHYTVAVNEPMLGAGLYRSLRVRPLDFGRGFYFFFTLLFLLLLKSGAYTIMIVPVSAQLKRLT
jgi:hypothetical protein